MNKKAGYCRDSARRRSLDSLRSFNVIDFGPNRKPVCYFLLVTYFHLAARFFSYRTVLVKFSLLTKVSLFNTLVRVNA